MAIWQRVNYCYIWCNLTLFYWHPCCKLLWPLFLQEFLKVCLKCAFWVIMQCICCRYKQNIKSNSICLKGSDSSKMITTVSLGYKQLHLYYDLSIAYGKWVGFDRNCLKNILLWQYLLTLKSIEVLMSFRSLSWVKRWRYIYSNYMHNYDGKNNDNMFSTVEN